MRRVLVTRPIDDAASLVAALTARGVDSLVEPLLAVRPTGTTLPPLDGVQALVFTSANGVRAFADASDHRDLPAYTVGEATAEAARVAGFQSVEAGGGDVDGLAELVEKRLTPTAGRLLHVAGTQVAGDLAGRLEKSAFQVDRVVLYEAVGAIMLSAAATEALEKGEVDSVLLFSPRTAELFAGLTHKAGLDGALSKVAAVCLSHAVAERLPVDRFRMIAVAARPDQAALLDAVDRATPTEAVVSLPTSTTAPPPPAPAPLAPSRVGFMPLLATGIGSVVATLALLAGTVDMWRPLFLPAPPPAIDSRPELQALARRVQALETAVPALDAKVAQAATAPTPAPASTAPASAAPTTSGVATIPAELLARIDRLEARPEVAASPPAPPPPPPVDLSPLTTRLAALEARPVVVPDPTAADRLARVEARLADAEGKITAGDGGAGRRAALALAVAQMSDVVRAGQPFAAQLAEVRRLAEGVDLAPLTAAGNKGVATVAALRADFAGAARKMASAAAIIESGEVLGELRGLLARAITIRRTEAPIEGDDLEARLARAERRLGEGDLAGAVASLDGLAEPVTAAAAEWLAQARARLAADKALAELSRLALGAR